jgi:hypothetical protein
MYYALAIIKVEDAKGFGDAPKRDLVYTACPRGISLSLEGEDLDIPSLLADGWEPLSTQRLGQSLYVTLRMRIPEEWHGKITKP